MNEKEREILKRYIKKNIKIGKIRRLKSEVGYLIFFIIKRIEGEDYMSTIDNLIILLKRIDTSYHL